MIGRVFTHMQAASNSIESHTGHRPDKRLGAKELLVVNSASA